MKPKWEHLANYVIAGVLFIGAVWLSWDWHWGIRLPFLGYLALCTLLFPWSKIPADLLIAGIVLGSPVHLTGLIAWLALALVYCVVWVLGPVFAPVGALIQSAARRTKPPERG